MSQQQTAVAILHEQYRGHMEAEDAFDDATLRRANDDDVQQKNALLIKRRLALQEAILTSRATSPRDAISQLAQISVEMDWLTGCHHTAEHMSDRIEILHAALASAVLALVEGCKIDLEALAGDYFPQRMECLTPLTTGPVRRAVNS